MDQAVIEVAAGDGGGGSASFRREKHVPRGGPDGGDGGRGGHIMLEADLSRRTLLELLTHTRFRAERGGAGSGNRRHGRRGADLVIKVPVGTEAYDQETSELLVDLVQPGQRWLAARGGAGGRGNVHFATSTEQAPHYAEKGAPGERYRLRLELKLLADVGLVGLPNAGKSTLLARVSAARPKIAAYPFTTLAPNLGIVRMGQDCSFVMADLPGLIEGAHRGLGRGFDFLRHVERSRVLLHVIDASAEEPPPLESFQTVMRELVLYRAEIAQLPQAVAANKMDLPLARERYPALRDALAGQGYQCLAISAVTGEGVPELMGAVTEMLEKAEPAASPRAAAEGRLYGRRPAPLEVEKAEEGLFVARGTGLERLIAMTDLGQAQAVRRLQGSLERMGVLARLRALGAKEGDRVRIGEAQFNYLEDPAPERKRRGKR